MSHCCLCAAAESIAGLGFCNGRLSQTPNASHPPEFQFVQFYFITGLKASKYQHNRFPYQRNLQLSFQQKNLRCCAALPGASKAWGSHRASSTLRVGTRGEKPGFGTQRWAAGSTARRRPAGSGGDGQEAGRIAPPDPSAGSRPGPQPAPEAAATSGARSGSRSDDVMSTALPGAAPRAGSGARWAPPVTGSSSPGRRARRVRAAARSSRAAR